MSAFPAPVTVNDALVQVCIDDVIEHAMRLGRDDLVVAHLAQSSPGSRAFLSALGRLLEDCPAAARRRLPLSCWAAGSTVPGMYADWRARVGVEPSSLWSELEFLMSLSHRGSWRDVASDPLAALLHLRGAA